MIKNRSEDSQTTGNFNTFSTYKSPLRKWVNTPQ
jgi:hypothetical protein